MSNPHVTILTPTLIAETRAALAAAKSTLCSHGVPHNACHQHPTTTKAATDA